MVRRLRIRLAHRKAAGIRTNIAVAPQDDLDGLMSRYEVAVDRWLTLDGRERFTCPRRLGPASLIVPPRRNFDWWRDDRTCSYCGRLEHE